MLKLIMLGLMGQEMNIVNSWFWWLYTANWILIGLQIIIYSMLAIIAIKNAKDSDE